MRVFNNFLSLLRIIGFFFNQDWFDQKAPENYRNLPDITLFMYLHDCRHYTTAETSIRGELDARCRARQEVKAVDGHQLAEWALFDKPGSERAILAMSELMDRHFSEKGEPYPFID